MKYIIKNNHNNAADLNKNEKQIWPKLINIYSEKLPNIFRLIYMIKILPVTIVPCEIGFSTLNFIKNKSRNSLGIKKKINNLIELGEEMLDLSLRAALEGPEINDFDFYEVLMVWRRKKERRF